tara:strand:- start:983 stop:1183 length:201 start_codon:yes stop_codon:yes gene_type:complete
MSEKTSIFSESEYREFSVRVKRLEELNVEFAYEVEYLKEDNTYKVTVYGDHDWDRLDEITNDAMDS